jgi:transposase-like protein
VRKSYSAEFKAQVVLEILKEEKSISQISSEYGVHPNILGKWKNQAVRGFPRLFADAEKKTQAMKAEHEKKVQELYEEIGRLTTQVNWFKKKGF